MSESACPRCKKPHDGRTDSRGWATCKECFNCWNLHAEAAAPAKARSPMAGWGVSDEYAPDDSGSARDRPLTTREQSAPRIVEPVRPQPAAARAKSAVMRLDEGLPAKLTSAIAEDLDSQLFDRLEAEAQSRRAKQATLVGVSAPAADGGAPDRVDCPVCGHSFPPVGEPKPGLFQTCPQCSTTFNLLDGKIAAASDGGGDGGDRLLARTIRGCTIDRKIGEGGMGAVYHAKQLSLDRSVAIKVMPAELARNKNFIQRFEREAKSLARINHPNILHIYDFGEDQALGIYFMIIEFVDGKDLGEMLRLRHTLDQIEVLDLMRQAALGLEMAAEKGVIHRDIKPDNLMISDDGICKVSDFGLAKGYGAFDDVTSTGVRVGTPAFMSPEQCDGKEVDFRSDIYSLGCTAYLALTGTLPFTGDSPFSIMLKHKTDPPPSVRTQNPDVDPRVDELVQRMLAKDPRDRCVALRGLIEDVEALQIELSGTSSILRASGGDRPLHRDSSGGHAAHRPRERRNTPLPARAPEPPADLRIFEPPPGAVPLQPLQPLQLMPAAPAPNAAPSVSDVDLSPNSGAPLPPEPGKSRASNRLGAVGARASDRMNAVAARPSDAPPAAAAADGEAPPSQTEQHVRRGDVHALEGRPSEAIESYQAALKRRPGNRDLQTKLADARRQQAELHIDDIERGGDALHAAGRVHEAVGEWLRASQLSANVRRREQLLGKVDRVQKALRRRRQLRRSVGAAFLFVLLLAGTYFWTPLVHNQLAERDKRAIDADADSTAKVERLREFAAANDGPWPWYPRLFAALERARIRTTYDVPTAAVALDEARELEARLQVQDVELVEQRETAAVAAIEALTDDAKVPWSELAKRADAAAADIHDDGRKARLAEIATRARQAQAEADAARRTLDSALSTGDGAQALGVADAIRRHHGRGGAAVTGGLPLPARIAVADNDGAGVPPGLAIVADGHPVAVGAPLWRFPDRDVVVEITAPGFLPERVLLAADPAPGERAPRPVALHPARAWTAKLPAAKWQRLWARDHRVVAFAADAIVSLSAADGGSLAAFTRSDAGVAAATRDPRWSWLDDAAALVGSSDGLIFSLHWTDGVPAKDQILRRGTKPVLGYVEKKLLFRDKLVQFVLEPSAQAVELVAYADDKELWRYAKLDGKLVPQLFTRDDKLYVADDFKLHVLDEEGSPLGTTIFPSLRTGHVALMSDGQTLLLPLDDGVRALRIGGRDVEDVPFPVGERPLAVACSGDAALIAGANARLHRIAFKDGAFSERWAQVLPDGRLPTRSPTLGDGAVGVVDQLGAFDVLADDDGAFIRRYPLDTPLSLPPLIVDGRVVTLVGDQLTAFQLPGAGR